MRTTIEPKRFAFRVERGTVVEPAETPPEPTTLAVTLDDGDELTAADGATLDRRGITSVDTGEAYLALAITPAGGDVSNVEITISDLDSDVFVDSYSVASNTGGGPYDIAEDATKDVELILELSNPGELTIDVTVSYEWPFPSTHTFRYQADVGAGEGA